jgi:hypothetical protein
MSNDAAPKALRVFVDTINATGGVVKFEDGTHAPEVDREWIDLGEAYISACGELGIEPQITTDYGGEVGELTEAEHQENFFEEKIRREGR